jgi:hypothetical protein
VRRILQTDRVDFHPKDFASYEEFEWAIDYLESLEAQGRIEILDRIRESQSGQKTRTGLGKWAVVVVRITDDGRKWLSI